MLVKDRSVLSDGTTPLSETCIRRLRQYGGCRGVPLKKHHIPPDGEETLYYHSDDQTVRYAVQLEGGLKEERVFADLSVPDGDTTA